MTGWRCGWIVGPEALIGHVERLSLCMLYGLPGFMQEAALQALTDSRGEMDTDARDLPRAAATSCTRRSPICPSCRC